MIQIPMTLGEGSWLVKVGCPEVEYNLFPGIRSSWLKHILRSPAHWLTKIVSKDEPTPLQKKGIQMHQAVLMGMESLQVLVAPDELSLATKAGIALKERAKEEGVQLIRQSTLDDIQGVCRSVNKDPALQEILARSRKEVSLISTVKVRGEDDLCKARFDVVPEGDFLLDFKFTGDARPESFVWRIMDFGYHLQAFHYLNVWNSIPEGVELPIPYKRRYKFMIVAVETEAPYGVRKYMLSDEFMELAEQRWKLAVATLQRCLLDNTFPVYTDEITMLMPPGEKRYELQEF